MRKTTGDGADFGLGWRAASYAFVGVEELGSRRDELTDRLEVAVVGMGDEAVFHSVIVMDGPLHRLAPRRPGPRRAGVGTRRLQEACPDLERVFSGRVAVAHGTSPGWRLLTAACPRLRPLAV